MRQTALAFRELEIALENPSWEYPECLIINEIGCFFYNGHKPAEKILGDLLKSDKKDKKYIAYCFLSKPKNKLSRETLKKITEFEADPANQELVKKAKKCRE